MLLRKSNKKSDDCVATTMNDDCKKRLIEIAIRLVFPCFDVLSMPIWNSMKRQQSLLKNILTAKWKKRCTDKNRVNKLNV